MNVIPVAEYLKYSFFVCVCVCVCVCVLFFVLFFNCRPAGNFASDEII